MDVADVVRLLDLTPHPEGGYYRETWRDSATEPRGAGTAIYYLLPAGVVSAWHRVDAVEIWHWYAGEPLDLSLSEDGEIVALLHLGPDIAVGQRPQAIVPAGAWQSAKAQESDGEGWTLVGCTVSPAFEFSGFEIAAADFNPGLRSPRAGAD